MFYEPLLSALLTSTFIVSLLKLSTSLLVIVTHLQLLITLLGNLIQRFSLPNKPHNPKKSKQRIVLCIPFLGHLCFNIRNKINKLIKSHYPCIKLQFVYKSPKRLSFLFKYKDFFRPLFAQMLFISARVVAAMPLILVRPSEILRFAVMSTLGLIKVEESVPLPVLHPSGILSSNQVILEH